MARPRGGDWLVDEIVALRNARVSTVVSLLEPRETAELELGAESLICARHAIEYMNLPVPDFGVPESMRAFVEFAGVVHERLVAGNTVAIHCRMGIGRSSLLAAAVLGLSGLGLDESLRRIASARGLRVPDTEAQVAWLRRLG